MLQEVEETAPTVRKLTINIPFSVIEEEVTKAYDELRVTAKIPGFRVGKAPLSILVKKFGKEVESKVIGKIIPEFYSKAVEKAHISPISYPSLDGEFKIIKDKPILFTATVEIKPELKALNYEGISLRKKELSVDEKEMQIALKALQESKALLNVSDVPLRESDMAIIDCEAFIEGNEVKELTSKDYPFIVGSQGLPQEFSDAIKGRKKGEQFEVKVHFDSSHHNKTIAGKEVLFKVAISETKEKVLPDLNDEFAKDYNYNNVDELKNKLRENIYNSKQKQRVNEYKKQLLDYLVENHSFEIPASMAEKETEFLVEEAKQAAARRGETIKSDDELSGEFKNRAYNNIKGMIILDAIGKKEKVELSEDDIQKAINELAVENQLKPEDIKKLFIMKDGSLDGFKHRIYTDKVLNFVLLKAVIN
jgi:trigger factor